MGALTTDSALREAQDPGPGIALRMPSVSRRRAAVGIGLIGLGFLPLAFGSFGLFIGTYVAVWAMLELSIVVVTGYAGLISLMPFSYVGIGVFTTGVATALWGWPFWLAVPLAALATMPVSLLVGAASVRLKGLYLAIATLTFGNALGETLFSWNAFTGGQEGYPVARPRLGALDLSGDFAFYALSLGTALALVWAVHGLKTSRVGRAMRAARENEQEAQLLAVNPVRARLTALVIGGAIAGVGGAFYAGLLGKVAPSGFQSPFVEIASILLVVWAVIGGIDSALGAFLGATALIVQQQVFQGAERLFAFVGVYGALVLVAFLVFRPGGIVQVIQIQSEKIKGNPRRHVPLTVVLFGGQVLLAYVILKLGSGG